jgi:biotin carboxylase
MNTPEPVVLLIGLGKRAYREYLLHSAAARHRLWLLDSDEPRWAGSYLAGWTRGDVLDRDLVLDAARRVADRRGVAGVLSWDELLIENTAYVADALGLPGATPAGVRGCRDKHRTRQALHGAGLPQPGFAWVTSAADAVRAAGRIGYPVVVKPRGIGASIGVVLARDEDEVRSAFHVADGVSQEAAPAYRGGALVEEYLAGEEISVDAAVFDGEYRPMFLARKDVGLFPHFEETGHTVDPADPLLRDERLVGMLAAAHRVIGLRYGVTHTEVKLTRRGPVIVEINGRLGGDLIPLLGRLATGIDAGVVAVDVATGRRPGLTPTRPGGHRVVGIRFGYPSRDCEVLSVDVPPATEPELLRAEALAEPGSTLRLPPNGYVARHSYVICAGHTRQECRTRLDRAIERVHLQWRPAPPPAGDTPGVLAAACGHAAQPLHPV